MLRQQINLYKLLPKKPKVRLTVEKLAVWYGLFFLLLMLVYSYGAWKKHQANNELDAANAEYKIEQEKMLAIGKKYGAINPEDLQGTLSQLQRSLKFRSSMIAELFDQVRMSDYLEGFAQADLPGAWLTSFTMKLKEQKIDLYGHSLRAIEAEHFRDQLQLQPIFSGITFVLQELEQPDAAANEKKYMNFHITTKGNAPVTSP